MIPEAYAISFCCTKKMYCKRIIVMLHNIVNVVNSVELMHFQMANRIFYACFTTEHSFQKLKSVEYLYKVPNFLASFHTAFSLFCFVVCACMCDGCVCMFLHVETHGAYGCR